MVLKNIRWFSGYVSDNSKLTTTGVFAVIITDKFTQFSRKMRILFSSLQEGGKL